MKSFIDIYKQENMRMPNNFKQAQDLSTDLSVQFVLTDLSRNFLKQELQQKSHLTGNIYGPLSLIHI